MDAFGVDDVHKVAAGPVTQVGQIHLSSSKWNGVNANWM